MDNIFNKKVDVIIPIHFPDEKFQMMFSMLQKQTVKINKYIICETVASIDDLNTPFNQPSSIEHFTILENEFDHGRTRNICAKKSDADYILFLTQDAIPKDEKLIENLLSSFEGNVAAVYAKQVPYPDCNIIEKLTRSFNYPSKDIIKNLSTEKEYGIKNYFCSNVCCMYNKKIFDELGCFEENVILDEDLFFSYKAIHKGYSIIYKSNAKVFHSHNYTNEEYFKRYFDTGVAQETSNINFNNIPSEKEGKKLVVSIFKFLIKKFDLINCVILVINSVFKYIGFKFGKNYKKLSKEQILRYTLNKSYWNNILN